MKNRDTGFSAPGATADLLSSGTLVPGVGQAPPDEDALNPSKRQAQPDLLGLADLTIEGLQQRDCVRYASSGFEQLAGSLDRVHP